MSKSERTVEIPLKKIAPHTLKRLAKYANAKKMSLDEAASFLVGKVLQPQ